MTLKLKRIPPAQTTVMRFIRTVRKS